VIVRAKAGGAGKLFGAVTSEAISKALKEQFDMDIEKNKIVQSEPIKTFGAFTVKAKLGFEVSGNIHVLVVEET
jgi:large subunit ribosomal protein L9